MGVPCVIAFACGNSMAAWMERLTRYMALVHGRQTSSSALGSGSLRRELSHFHVVSGV